MYWYISATKIAAMMANDRHRRLSQMRIKLGAFGVEAEAEAASEVDQRHGRDLAKLRKRLERDHSILGFDEIKDPAPLFSFSGPAASAMQAGRFLVAIRGAQHALSLVGSSGNVVGQKPAEVTISPSAMPGVAAASFSNAVEAHAEVTGAALSYEWQLVVRQAGGAHAILPSVRGYAVFGGMYPASKRHLRRAGGGDLTNIVVGSPVYIEQA